MNKIKFIEGVHPSYESQWQKLTTAYIKGEINPYDACACFVGNLLNGTKCWIYEKHHKLGSIHEEVLKSVYKESAGLYTPDEVLEIEEIFMKETRNFKLKDSATFQERLMVNYTEDSLFKGFELALAALKKLHISKGEKVDKTFTFKKRNYENVQTTI